MADEYSILIKNGVIVDGSGVAAFKGSVAVKGDKIAAVGKVKGDAKVTIDAKGLTISPGWIDVHNHGDLSLIYYPRADGFVRQGITTFVGGQCGNSPAPVGDYVGNPWMLSDVHKMVDPRMYDSEWLHERGAFNKAHRELYGWEIDWRSNAEYFKRMEKLGFSPNFVPMVGHGEVRSVAMGLDYKREATKREIKQMVELTDEAMRDGCVGVTVGRDYDPGIYAGFDEILACAKAAAKYGGVYASHSLRTGHRKARKPGEPNPVAVKGVLEAIEVGRKAKMSVQVSHLGVLYAVTPADSPLMNEAAINATLKIIDDARGEGMDVCFDQIPNHAAGGIGGSPYLVNSLAPWLKAAGSPEQLGKALRMPDWRQEIKESINAGKHYGLNPWLNPGWAEGGKLVECADPRFKGKTVAEVAADLKVDQLEALMQVIIADPYTKVYRSGGDDSKLLALMKHPEGMVGIDVFAVDDTWKPRTPTGMLPCENSFGGFPRYFRRAVRETKTLTLEEAVRKVTSSPARKFKLAGRGLLKEGYAADLTVFNPETITDKGNALEPMLYPEGVEHVIVNGVAVVSKNRHTGATPGKILRRRD